MNEQLDILGTQLKAEEDMQPQEIKEPQMETSSSGISIQLEEAVVKPEQDFRNSEILLKIKESIHALINYNETGRKEHLVIEAPGQELIERVPKEVRFPKPARIKQNIPTSAPKQEVKTELKRQPLSVRDIQTQPSAPAASRPAEMTKIDIPSDVFKRSLRNQNFFSSAFSNGAH